MLLVSSTTADDHLEWCGLVESKIRYLILNLERNQHINLAHVNPNSFDPIIKNDNNETTNDDSVGGGETTVDKSNKHCSMWFIGLEFERSDNLNVDLTDSIQSFTDSVHKNAVSSSTSYS